MTIDMVVDVARETIWVILKCAMPMLLVSLSIGLIVSIFQTITSIHEQTLTFVPKLLGIFIVLVIAGGWILNNIATYAVNLYSRFPEFIK